MKKFTVLAFALCLFSSNIFAAKPYNNMESQGTEGQEMHGKMHKGWKNKENMEHHRGHHCHCHCPHHHHHHHYQDGGAGGEREMNRY